MLIMELNEIKQAILNIRLKNKAVKYDRLSKDEVRQLMDDFLCSVLGYDYNDEIIHKSIPHNPHQNITDFNSQIKFLVQPFSGGQQVNQSIINQAVNYALAVGTQLLVLTNGIYFGLYDLDIDDGKIEALTVFELDLLSDAADEIAIALWPICKKDCGKNIIVNMS